MKIKQQRLEAHKMNDIGYENIPFEGSFTERSILNIRDVESLKFRKRYEKMAISYHQKEQNPKQLLYFKKALELVNKRIKKLKK